MSRTTSTAPVGLPADLDLFAPSVFRPRLRFRHDAAGAAGNTGGGDAGAGGQGGTGTGQGGANGGTGGTGTGTADAAAGGQGGTGGDGTADRGYPDHTPLEQMNAEQREAYWRYQARKHESTIKAAGDLGELQRKAGEFDRITAEQASEIDKARATAREEGKAEGRTESQVLIAEYALRGSLSHVAPDVRDTLLGRVNLQSFVGTDGRPDEQAIASFVAAVAPNAAGGTGTGGTGGGTGGHGGYRPPGGGTSTATGRDRYQEKHGGKKP